MIYIDSSTFVTLLSLLGNRKMYANNDQPFWSRFYSYTQSYKSVFNFMYDRYLGQFESSGIVGFLRKSTSRFGNVEYIKSYVRRLGSARLKSYDLFTFVDMQKGLDSEMFEISGGNGGVPTSLDGLVVVWLFYFGLVALCLKALVVEVVHKYWRQWGMEIKTILMLSFQHLSFFSIR